MTKLPAHRDTHPPRGSAASPGTGPTRVSPLGGKGWSPPGGTSKSPVSSQSWAIGRPLPPRGSLHGVTDGTKTNLRMYLEDPQPLFTVMLKPLTRGPSEQAPSSPLAVLARRRPIAP